MKILTRRSFLGVGASSPKVSVHFSDRVCNIKSKFTRTIQRCQILVIALSFRTLNRSADEATFIDASSAAYLS